VLRSLRLRIAFGAFALLLLAPPGAARELNGFELSEASLPEQEIIGGGPPRDGIKSVDKPSFVAAEAASWVKADTPVIGIEVAGEARAYPVHLLEYHQLVNDEVGSVPVLLSYDPLTGTPIAFKAKVGDERLHFGVSGLVYQSNFLFYDRESESLWSQMLGRAVSGPRKGQRLERLPVRQEAFGVWMHRHPKSRVLERPFPKRIDYRYSRFSAYWISETIPFPVSEKDDRFHPKEGVLGLEVEGVVRAYPRSALVEAGGRVADEVAGKKVRIAYDAEADAFSWEVPEGVQVTDAYWFAWKAFHPKTEVWQLDAAAKP